VCRFCFTEHLYVPERRRDGPEAWGDRFLRKPAGGAEILKALEQAIAQGSGRERVASPPEP